MNSDIKEKVLKEVLKKYRKDEMYCDNCKDILSEYNYDLNGWFEKAIDLTLTERDKEVGKVIDNFLNKNYIEIMEIRDILDILRDDIRDNVESIDVDGKAFSRTSDIDNSIDAKEEEIKQI